MGSSKAVVSFSLLGFAPNLIAFLFLPDWQTQLSIGVCTCVSAFGFWATFRLIPVLARLTVAKGLWGEVSDPGSDSIGQVTID
jgi:hypothetical protein